MGDITYLPTWEEWLYLAIMLDLASHTVIGWALRASMDTELVMAALTIAAQHRRLAVGTVFHND